MKKVSVIIVNFNTSPILKECIENLQKMPASLKGAVEIIVVDNGSTDNSVEMVKNSFPGVILVEAENNGLAVGSNLGMEKASGEYILFLGSDAFPEPGVIEGMVDYMDERDKIGIATCKLVTRDGNPDMDAHRGFPTPWAAITHFAYLNRLFPRSKIFNQYFLGWKDLNKPHQIDLCISHFMLVKRKVFDEVGRWDETYFLYGEDVDLCYRVKEAGWEIWYLPQWKAVHYKGVSVGIRKESADITRASEETKRLISGKTTEAMKNFYNKHYSLKYPKAVTGFVILGIILLGKFRAVLVNIK